MNNLEKLAAIERGDRGSYNFAPRRDAEEDFQALARRARLISRERGYFVRCVEESPSCIAALLVTIN